MSKALEEWIASLEAEYADLLKAQTQVEAHLDDILAEQTECWQELVANRAVLAKQKEKS